MMLFQVPVDDIRDDARDGVRRACRTPVDAADYSAAFFMRRRISLVKSDFVSRGAIATARNSTV